LFEEHGKYFITFGDRTGAYREFVRMLFSDNELLPDLLTGDARANFLTLMKLVSERWNNQIAADFIRAKGE